MLIRMASSNLAVRKILLAITGKIGAIGSQQPVGIREMAGAGEDWERTSAMQSESKGCGDHRGADVPGRAQTEERGPGVRALRLEGV